MAYPHQEGLPANAEYAATMVEQQWHPISYWRTAKFRGRPCFFEAPIFFAGFADIATMADTFEQGWGEVGEQ